MESVETARLQAAAWLATHPRPGVACFAGMMALEAGDWDNAIRLRNLCCERGGDREGFIDWLDLQLVIHGNDKQAIEDLYRRLEMRYLTPLVAKTVLDYFLIQAMFTEKLGAKSNAAPAFVEHRGQPFVGDGGMGAEYDDAATMNRWTAI